MKAKETYLEFKYDGKAIYTVKDYIVKEMLAKRTQHVNNIFSIIPKEERNKENINSYVAALYSIFMEKTKEFKEIKIKELGKEVGTSLTDTVVSSLFEKLTKKKGTTPKKKKIERFIFHPYGSQTFDEKKLIAVSQYNEDAYFAINIFHYEEEKKYLVKFLQDYDINEVFFMLCTALNSDLTELMNCNEQIKKLPFRNFEELLKEACLAAEEKHMFPNMEEDFLEGLNGKKYA